MRLSKRDEHKIAEISAELRIKLNCQTYPAMEFLTSQLCEMLNLHMAGAYGIELQASGFAPSFCHISGAIPEKHVLECLRLHLSGHSTRWGMYNPLHPEWRQRNRTIITSPLTKLCRAHSTQTQNYLLSIGVSKNNINQALSYLINYGKAFLEQIGCVDLHQIRTLVCDENGLLTWVGGFRDRPFSQREQLLLHSLIPELINRLRVVQRMEISPIMERALLDVLDRLPYAAFMASSTGRVIHANNLGKAIFERDPHGLTRKLAEAIHQKPQHPQSRLFDVSTVTAPGLPTYHLLLQKTPETHNEEIADQVAIAATEYKLTSAQKKVLWLVMRGKQNKEIATALSCSPHTVALHVNAILDKAGLKGSRRPDLMAQVQGLCKKRT